MSVLKILSAIALGFVLAWGGTYLWAELKAPAHDIGDPHDFLPKGGDFTLQSVKGDVSLSDYRGKVVVLYFGYTACPDICPTSMATMKQAFKLLQPSELAQLQGILVSVDPERDSLEHTQRYAQYFHPKIIGVSGELPYLEKLVRQYDAFFRKVEMPDSAMGYAVDHTATIYVIDKQGKLSELVAHAVPPKQLADAIRRLL